MVGPAGLAARVIFLREEQGKTRAQVERGVPIKHSLLWRIENDAVKSPNLVIIVGLAKFFGVTTDYLLGVES